MYIYIYNYLLTWVCVAYIVEEIASFWLRVIECLVYRQLGKKLLVAYIETSCST